MGWHTHLVLARRTRIDDLTSILPDVFDEPDEDISFEEASSSSLAPHLAAAELGDWLALWDPIGRVAAEAFAGTALALTFDGASGTYAYRWTVDGKLADEARIAPPSRADENWAFSALQRLTGISYGELEDASYRRIPFEDAGDDEGYSTAVMFLRGGTLAGVSKALGDEFELCDTSEALENGQFPDPDYNCDLGAAELGGWLVLWDPSDETLWDEVGIETQRRLLAGATAFVAYLKDKSDWYGFRWFVDGELRRQFVMFHGHESEDEITGAPLPEEEAGRKDAAWMLAVGRKLSGLSADELERARYCRFRRK